MGKIDVLQLKNGIRVLVVPMVGRKSVVAQVTLKMGAKYEKKGEWGMSHFLEHMAFKGSDRWPTPQSLSREIDSKGASCNAETTEETVSYYIKTTKDKLDWALDLLAEIVWRSKIPEIEVNKERGVIIEEIKMYQDNPLMGLSDEFTKLVLEKSPIGCWDVAGGVEDVGQINRKGLIDYRDKYLNPREMMVTVAGDVDQARVEKYFGEFENKKAIKLPKVEMVFGERKEMKKKKNGVEQGHFVIGGRGWKRQDEKRYALRILMTVLAGSMSSRLYDELREKRGWAYYVYGLNKSLVEGGVFGVQSGVRKDKLDEAIDLVEKEIIGLSDSLKLDEVERAKEQSVARLEMMMDEVEFWAGATAEKLLLEGAVVDVAEELKKYAGVKLKEVKEVAEALSVKKDLYKLTVSQ